MKKYLIPLFLTFLHNAYALEEVKDNVSNSACFASFQNYKKDLGTYSTWTGTCVDGKANGNGTFTVKTKSDDKLVIAGTGTFTDGYLNGYGEIKFANNTYYKGEIQKNLGEGKGIRSYTDGALSEGMFKNGLPYGEHIVTNTNKTKHVTHFFGTNSKKGVYVGPYDPKLELSDTKCTMDINQFIFKEKREIKMSHLALNLEQELNRVQWIKNEKRVGYCEAKHNFDIFQRSIIKHNYTNFADAKFAINSGWTGDCVDGKISGQGKLVLGYGNRCQPTYWLFHEGVAENGYLKGTTKTTYFSHASQSQKGEATLYFDLSRTYASKRDYEEELNPSLKTERLQREEEQRLDILRKEQQEKEEYEKQRRYEEQKFDNLKNKSNAREAYLAAHEFESYDRYKSIEIYNSIIKRFPNSNEALLSTQRISKFKDQDRQDSILNDIQAGKERDLEANKQQCYNRYNACHNSCQAISNDKARLTCYSGCEICN